MKLVRFSFTFLSALLFIFALGANGMLFGSARISQNVANDPHIVPGEIGGIFLVAVSTESVPHVAPRHKVLNHKRTLRAFLASEQDGGDRKILYIEQIKPHAFYAIHGDFFMSRPETSLAWTSDTVLVVRVILPSGERGTLLVDLEARESLFITRADSPPVLPTTLRGNTEIL